jgi:acylaminoacyl-peptidase
VETLGIESYTDDPSLETLAHMRSKSPIAHVANVAEKKRPVMMLIGAADRRVPPTNGLRYAAALRAAGGTCHVRVFPEDAHGLVKPRTEFESFVSIATFLRETLG